MREREREKKKESKGKYVERAKIKRCAEICVQENLKFFLWILFSYYMVYRILVSSLQHFTLIAKFNSETRIIWVVSLLKELDN